MVLFGKIKTFCFNVGRLVDCSSDVFNIPSLDIARNHTIPRPHFPCRLAESNLRMLDFQILDDITWQVAFKAL